MSAGRLHDPLPSWESVATGTDALRWSASRARGSLALVLCLLLLRSTPIQAQLPDVPAALANISPDASSITFDRGAAPLPPGGHLQGVQMRFDAAHNRLVAFLSHDSATAGYLVVVEFPADLAAAGRIVAVHTFPSDGRLPPLRHAGGIQLVENILVVGLEDNQQKTRSEIQFWNTADPFKLVQLAHLTIRRQGAPKDKTAGAVGIVKRASDYLLAVANWDSRAIDFYASNRKPLADPACRFDPLTRWQDAGADKSAWRPDGVFGRYQAVNLLADAAQNVFLVGFPTAAADVVDLYAVDVAQQPLRILRKLAGKTMRLPRASKFQFAAGISILRDGPAILASPRGIDAQTTLGIAR